MHQHHVFENTEHTYAPPRPSTRPSNSEALARALSAVEMYHHQVNTAEDALCALLDQIPEARKAFLAYDMARGAMESEKVFAAFWTGRRDGANALLRLLNSGE